ncbi:esterase lipase thioesterase family protein [Favolaschia claudopus]|uniref:Esterase lipase thioesterase family protein n=1 Tax=Favolaschia claudopus TaxID=2862362 RepID=A0AAW0CCM1_9AGAR
MDAIAQMQETDIMTILLPTISTFVPLLEPKREEILNARKTFKYGNTDRHQLDVYYPPPPPSGGRLTNPSPILLYIYGGGFVSGEKTLPTPADLAYGNVGLYFASHGFVTIIPDYRLAPQTTYPGPAEDLRDALAWVVAHPEHLGDSADTSSVFFLGHSAGGTHTMTLLLEPSILASAPGLAKRIKGAAIASTPFHFDLGEAGGGADLALITCERDPEWFKIVLRDFHKELGERKVESKLVVADVHTHISFSFALGTGQGEKWAEEIVEWARAQL